MKNTNNTPKFKTHNDNIPFIGGSLQGYVDASYKELVTLFGEPTDSDGYKVDAEWEILFDTGEFARIYNYKDGVNYMGAEGTPKEDIRDWHIGGTDKTAMPIINHLLAILRTNTTTDNAVVKSSPLNSALNLVYDTLKAYVQISEGSNSEETKRIEEAFAIVRDEAMKTN